MAVDDTAAGATELVADVSIPCPVAASRSGIVGARAVYRDIAVSGGQRRGRVDHNVVIRLHASRDHNATVDVSGPAANQHAGHSRPAANGRNTKSDAWARNEQSGGCRVRADKRSILRRILCSQSRREEASALDRDNTTACG